MATVTLQHCESVTIFQSDVAVDVGLDIAVGGVATDGAVTLGSAPAAPVPDVPIACGSSGTPTVSPCTTVTLHYVKSSLGPDTVTVTYSLQVP